VNPLHFHRDFSARTVSAAFVGALALGGAAVAQSTAYLDTKLINGATTAVVAPGQSFPLVVRVRSTTPVSFNAALLRFISTEQGLRLDDYLWSPPFVTGGSGDYSLGGDALPLVINDDTLQGPGYPIETADVQFGVFDFFLAAHDGDLLRLWVRAPKRAVPGSHFFIAAVADQFTNGFLPVPMTTGTTLRVEVVASGNQGDVNADGAVNSADLTSLLTACMSPV
jgi:hypothetical protein